MQVLSAVVHPHPSHGEMDESAYRPSTAPSEARCLICNHLSNEKYQQIMEAMDAIVKTLLAHLWLSALAVYL